MRVSYWWVALLLGCAPVAYAEEIPGDMASDDMAAMEVIEMLGEMDDDVAVLDIAMSDVNLNATATAQEVSDAE